jgi:sialate O-acetylesterase
MLMRTAPLAILTILSTAALADLELPAVIADHMVLQRDTPVVLWGWADPGDWVEANFAGQTKRADTDGSGRWEITLDAMPASAEGRTLTFIAGDDTAKVQDVLVGEVWVCSGQSNMVWTVRNSQHADEFIAGADDPRIRMFIVPNVAAHEPQERCSGEWLAATPQTVGRFSAVAYHFARNLIEKLDVPIGLVNSSWGGSSVEAWVSRPALERVEAARPFLEAYDETYDVERMDVGEFVGAGPSDWDTMELPTLIENAGLEIDGIVWFRRTVIIPESWAGQELTLELGPIDDNDVTYFNGRRVGSINSHRTPRVYNVPADLVEAGEVVLAVRVEDTGGAGGFNGTPEQLRLRLTDTELETIPLAGTWHHRVVAERASLQLQHRPANLYNAMIHPLERTAVRGVIWYQGENNAIRPRGEEYFTIFPALIDDWRRAFDEPDLPFYFVQLPNFTNNEPNTVWRYPVLRQAQLHTLRTVPHTGMAVTLELGEARDIHPRNKHDVGDRLARWALVDTYGFEGIVTSGPIFRAVKLEGQQARISFDLYGSPLRIGDGEILKGFEVAGPDGTFVAAQARIDRDEVVVRSLRVGDIRAVRYAWRNNAIDANLVNAEGLPASPFDTAFEP